MSSYVDDMHPSATVTTFLMGRGRLGQCRSRAYPGTRSATITLQVQLFRLALRGYTRQILAEIRHRSEEEMGICGQITHSTWIVTIGPPLSR